MADSPIDRLMLLHGWLRYALPLDSKGILGELQTGYRGSPATYKGFPLAETALGDAMGELAKKRLVELVGEEWHWRNAREAEPQGQLF